MANFVGTLLYVIWIIYVVYMSHTSGVASLYLPSVSTLQASIPAFLVIGGIYGIFGWGLKRQQKAYISLGSLSLYAVLIAVVTCWMIKSMPGKQELDMWTVIGKIALINLPLLCLTIVAYGVGHLILSRDKDSDVGYIEPFVLGFGVILFLVTTLFFVGVGLLSAFWGVLGVGGVGFIWMLVRKTYSKTPPQLRISPLFLLIFTGFVFVLTIFQINAIRPFPIGWDEIQLYMNAAHLMSQTDAPLSGMGISAWTIFVAIGYSISGASGGSLFSIFPYIFVPACVHACLRLVSVKPISGSLGWLAGLIIITIPMMQFMAVQDLKVDPALTLFGVTAVIFLLRYIQDKSVSSVLSLAFLLGICISIKLTATYLIIATLSVLVYLWGGVWLLIGLVSALLGLLGWTNVSALMYIDIMPTDTIFLIGTLILGACGVLLSRRVWSKKRPTVQVLFFCIALVLPLMPWFGKNTYEALQAQRNVTLSNIITGYNSDRIFPKLRPKSAEQSGPKTQQVDHAIVRCGKKRANEDLGKFAQEDCGLMSYVDAPHRTTFVLPHLSRLFFVTPLFLIGIGYLLLVGRKVRYVTGGSLVLLILLYGQHMPWMTAPIFPFGYVIVGLLFGYGTYLLIKNGAHIILSLLVGIYSFWYAISGQFVPWYGIFSYVLILLLLFVKGSDEHRKSISYIHSVLLISYIIIFCVLGSLYNMQRVNFIPYKSGKADVATSLSQTFPTLISPLRILNLAPDKLEQGLFSEIIDPPEGKENKEKILRVGTFFQYFIHDSRSRVFADDLLQVFDRIIPLVPGSGIRYVLIDTNTGSIDTSDEGSLKQRYAHALQLLRFNQAQLIDTDNICLWIGFYEPSLDERVFEILTTTQFGSQIGDEWYDSQRKKDTCIFYIQDILKKYEKLPENLSRLKRYTNLQDPRANILSDLQMTYYGLFSVSPAQ